MWTILKYCIRSWSQTRTEKHHLCNDQPSYKVRPKAHGQRSNTLEPSLLYVACAPMHSPHMCLQDQSHEANVLKQVAIFFFNFAGQQSASIVPTLLLFFSQLSLYCNKLQPFRI